MENLSEKVICGKSFPLLRDLYGNKWKILTFITVNMMESFHLLQMLANNKGVPS